MKKNSNTLRINYQVANQHEGNNRKIKILIY